MKIHTVNQKENNDGYMGVFEGRKCERKLYNYIKKIKKKRPKQTDKKNSL